MHAAICTEVLEKVKAQARKEREREREREKGGRGNRRIVKQGCCGYQVASPGDRACGGGVVEGEKAQLRKL